MYHVSWIPSLEYDEITWLIFKLMLEPRFFIPGGLKHLKKLILHKCNYLDNEALLMLAAVKDSLEELQLSSCGDINDKGVKSLSCLSNLHHLLLFDLPEVRNREDCLQFLHSALPRCDVEFPYANVSEIKNDKEWTWSLVEELNGLIFISSALNLNDAYVTTSIR